MKTAAERFDMGMVSERFAVEPGLLELDHRSFGSVDVSLWWWPQTRTVVLEVVDWEGEDFAVQIEPALAHDAFLHPFSYAPREEP
jgi:hypothetical protein